MKKTHTAMDTMPTARPVSIRAVRTSQNWSATASKAYPAMKGMPAAIIECLRPILLVRYDPQSAPIMQPTLTMLPNKSPCSETTVGVPDDEVHLSILRTSPSIGARAGPVNPRVYLRRRKGFHAKLFVTILQNQRQKPEHESSKPSH